MKKTLMNILKYIIVFIILILIYIGLITLVNTIPSSYMEENIKESAVVLKEQTEEKKYNFGYKEETIFNFSDALMLNMAYSVDCKHPFESMILSRKDYLPGVTKKENTKATVNIGTDSRFINKITGDVSHTGELYQFINNKDMEESFEYARYWHGYMIFLRPLLTVFNITQIRILLSIIIIGISALLIYLIYKKINIISAIVFTLGFIACSIFIVGQSISEVSVFLVMLGISIVLLLKKDLNKNIGIIFMISGSLASFLDLFTEPLISAFIPITIYFLLIQKDEKLTIKECLKKYIFLCVMWGIGYGLTWMLKWVLLDVLKGREIFKQSLQQMLVRSSVGDFTYKLVLDKVYEFFSVSSVYAFLLLPTIILIIAGFIKERNNKNIINICLIPFILNCLAPFVWYFIVKNHSYKHPFFSYKLLSITVINFLIIVSIVFNFYKIRNKEKEVKK